MSNPIEEALKLNQESGLVEFFEVDLTNSGAGVYYLTNLSSPDGYITFGGVQYVSFQIALGTAEITVIDSMPTTTLVAQLKGNTLLAAALSQYGDLAGGKVIRFKTYEKFLDGKPEANSAMRFSPDVFIIDSISSRTPAWVTWKLTLPVDRQFAKIPYKRVLKDNIPNHIYAPGIERVRN